MNLTPEEFEKKQDEIIEKGYKIEQGKWKPIKDYNFNQKLEELLDNWIASLEVGDRVHIFRDNDPMHIPGHPLNKEPGTIVKKTPTLLVVRLDNAECKDGWRPKYEEDVCPLHCLNNLKQKWIITENTTGLLLKFRWYKRKKRWVHKSGLMVMPGWEKFFNFDCQWPHFDKPEET